MLVIALDSPTDPRSAVDALFATNNFNAGVLIGKYARAATRGRTVTIGMLDEHAGSSVGKLRHDGFLKGFGIKGGNKQIACVGNGQGQVAPSQTANSETSGPARNSSITTRPQASAWARASARSRVTTTPLPAASASSFTT